MFEAIAPESKIGKGYPNAVAQLSLDACFMEEKYRICGEEENEKL